MIRVHAVLCRVKLLQLGKMLVLYEKYTPRWRSTYNITRITIFHDNGVSDVPSNKPQTWKPPTHPNPHTFHCQDVRFSFLPASEMVNKERSDPYCLSSVC